MNGHQPLVLVDTSDLIVGFSNDFKRVHRDGTPHRAVHFVIVDTRGRFFIWIRQDGRKETLGGHVDWLENEKRAETYEEAALRELMEELNLIANGVALDALRRRLTPSHKIINQLPSSHGNNNEWVTVFHLSWDDSWGDPCTNGWKYADDPESDSGRSPQWLSLDEIKTMCLANPAGINAALRHFMSSRGMLIPIFHKPAEVDDRA